MPNDQVTKARARVKELASSSAKLTDNERRELRGLSAEHPADLGDACAALLNVDADAFERGVARAQAQARPRTHPLFTDQEATR